MATLFFHKQRKTCYTRAYILAKLRCIEEKVGGDSSLPRTRDRRSHFLQVFSID
jgi:hypothetical protein